MSNLEQFAPILLPIMFFLGTINILGGIYILKKKKVFHLPRRGGSPLPSKVTPTVHEGQKAKREGITVLVLGIATDLIFVYWLINYLNQSHTFIENLILVGGLIIMAVVIWKIK